MPGDDTFVTTREFGEFRLDFREFKQDTKEALTDISGHVLQLVQDGTDIKMTVRDQESAIGDLQIAQESSQQIPVVDTTTKPPLTVRAQLIAKWGGGVILVVLGAAAGREGLTWALETLLSLIGVG
jgi:hypothetical protein